jgi:hypothetical protein
MVEKRKYADRKEELIRAVAKRRRKIKTLAIEYKGGKCQVCGYNKYQGALDLHHFCANCHREIEAGITQLPGGIQVEKRGEIGETHTASATGNTEPSL